MLTRMVPILQRAGDKQITIFAQRLIEAEVKPRTLLLVPRRIVTAGRALTEYITQLPVSRAGIAVGGDREVGLGGHNGMTVTEPCTPTGLRALIGYGSG